jgi:hypothetical protein
MSETVAAAGVTTSPQLPPLPSPERLQELLFDAARAGRDDIIPALIEAGAFIEAHDERGFTPLVLASYNGQESTTALLLKMSALPDGRPEDGGSSALMGVGFKGYAAIARLLLDHEADPNRCNRAGQTPLMMAALFGQIEIITMLLAAGADRTLRDASGNIAADVAAAQGNDEVAALLAI